MRLDGARCLITGCSSGIGRATALALASAGARVCATARRSETIAELRDHGIETNELDVDDESGIVAAVAQAEPIDVLVNNAGYAVEGAIEEIGRDELRAQYETNLFGPWRLCAQVLPGMRNRGRGAIVQVSSFGGEAVYPGIGAYRSSKWALEGMTLTLALEVAPFGVRVIDVQPGLVESGFETRIVTAAGMTTDSPYAPMHAAAAEAYPRMSPEALPAEEVADRIVTELSLDAGPLRVPVGEDAKRMIAHAQQGPEHYADYLTQNLGLRWSDRTSIAIDGNAKVDT